MSQEIAQIPCRPRSRLIALVVIALAFMGVGIFAAQWGLRRAIGVDRSAVITGAIVASVGVGFIALWIWLIRRPVRNLLRIDPPQRTLELMLNRVLHSARSFDQCGSLWLVESFRMRHDRPGSAWFYYEVWATGFERPLLNAGSRGAADKAMRALANACGLAVDEKRSSGRVSEADDQRRQLARIETLEAQGQRAMLLECLDPRVGVSDPERKALDTTNDAALAALGRVGDADAAARLRSLGTTLFAGQRAFAKAAGRVCEEIEARTS